MNLNNTAFRTIGSIGGQAHSRYAAEKRNEFDYFLNEGAVSWQWDKTFKNL